MKRIVFNAIIFLSLGIYGQDSLYYNSMKDAVDSMNNIKSLDDFSNIANIFERIAKTEKDKWLPYYYTGYIYVILGFKKQGSGKLDEYLDIAQENINRAMEIKPEESELYALQGLLYQARVMVDPQTRGAVYSPQATQALEKAIELDEDNPRPYYLMGTNLFYTPEAYGGGMEAACPMLQTAKEKYENFVPSDSISPNWGEDFNLQLAEKCNE